MDKFSIKQNIVLHRRYLIGSNKFNWGIEKQSLFNFVTSTESISTFKEFNNTLCY